MNEIKIYTNQISPSVPCSESRYFILYMLFQSSDDNTMDIKQDVHNASCFILVPDRWEKRDGWPSNCESINILVHWYFKIQGSPDWNSPWNGWFYSINTCRRKITRIDNQSWWKNTYYHRFQDCLHSMKSWMEKKMDVFFYFKKMGFFRLNILSYDNVYKTFYITFQFNKIVVLRSLKWVRIFIYNLHKK